MDSKLIDAGKYDTDKAEHPHYLRAYEDYFRPLLDKEVRLLELGVYKGGSLLLWRDYFERGLIVGLDLQPIKLDDPTGRIRIYEGLQQNRDLRPHRRPRTRRRAAARRPVDPAPRRARRPETKGRRRGFRAVRC